MDSEDATWRPVGRRHHVVPSFLRCTRFSEGPERLTTSSFPSRAWFLLGGTEGWPTERRRPTSRKKHTPCEGKVYNKGTRRVKQCGWKVCYLSHQQHRASVLNGAAGERMDRAAEEQGSLTHGTSPRSGRASTLCECQPWGVIEDSPVKGVSCLEPSCLC